jgi:hypothetical protein
LQHPRIRALRRLGIANGGFADEMIDAARERAVRAAGMAERVRRTTSLQRTSPGSAPRPGYDRLVELVFDGPAKYALRRGRWPRALGAATRLPALRILRLRDCLMDGATAQACCSSPLAPASSS